MMQHSNPPAYVTDVGGFPPSYETSKAPKKPIDLHHWSKLGNLKRRGYLVKRLLEEGSLSVIYGESNSGKTFFALDLAAHISLGWLWQGRRVKKGTVVYIAAESGQGIAERVNAFRIKHAPEEYGDLFLAMRTIILSGEDNDCDQLIEKIQETDNVKLVVIDTLARAMGGGNENSPDDMGFLIRCCDRIREETGAHVMLIHHSGKDSERGARGHSSLRAAIDTEIKVSKQDGIITAEVVKQRDGATGDQFSFELQQVEVGVDEDNEPTFSCVLSPSDFVPKKKRLSGQKQRALNILQNCLIDRGQKRIPKAGMVQVNCVTLDEYRDYLKQDRISSSDKQDTINKAITRAIDELNNSRITACYENYIWIADREDKTGQTISG